MSDSSVTDRPATDSAEVVALNPTTPPADTTNSGTLTNLAQDHPFLLILGGAAVGVLASVALTRPGTKKFAQKASALAATAGEFGAQYGRLALEKADELSRESREKLEDLGENLANRTADARDHAARSTSEASEVVRAAASAFVRHALDLATKARK